MDFLPSHRLRSLMAGRNQPETPRESPAVPVFLVEKRLKGVHVPVQCEFRGFHAPEALGSRCFLWSQDRGELNCRFVATAKLKCAWLELEATAPEGSTISISWDNLTLVKNRKVKGRTSVPIHLPESTVTDRVDITITSTTFVPCERNMGDDPRILGVAVRGLIFAKRSSKYRPRSAFPVPLRQRIYKLLPKWTRQTFLESKPNRHSRRAA